MLAGSRETPLMGTEATAAVPTGPLIFQAKSTREGLDAIRVAEFPIDPVDGLQPLVRVGVEGDHGDVIPAHFHEELAEDDPLHGLVDVVEDSRVVAELNGGAVPLGVEIQAVVTGLVIAQVCLGIVAIIAGVPEASGPAPFAIAAPIAGLQEGLNR